MCKLKNKILDLSKKHNRRKNSIDINHLFTDLIKTDEINLGKRFKPDTKADNDIKLSKKNELFPSKILKKLIFQFNLI
jgi:hypothetical protein